MVVRLRRRLLLRSRDHAGPLRGSVPPRSVVHRARSQLRRRLLLGLRHGVAGRRVLRDRPHEALRPDAAAPPPAPPPPHRAAPRPPPPPGPPQSPPPPP